MQDDPPHQPAIRREHIVLALGLALIAALFIRVANQLDIENLPLAFDWKVLWSAVGRGHVEMIPGFLTPPWGILVILPLTFLSLRTSWGIVMFMTFIAVQLSLPRGEGRIRTILAILLAAVSYPVLRIYAEGNIDGLVILGVLLMLYGYEHERPLWTGIGILFAVVKPQIVFLLMVLVGIDMLRYKPRRYVILTALVVVGIVVPSILWLGRAWFEVVKIGVARGISLQWLLASRGVPQVVISMIRIVVGLTSLLVAGYQESELSRENIGLLVTASILVAPYASNLSAVVPFAFVALMLFVKEIRGGILLVCLFNVPYVLAVLGLRPYGPDRESAYLMLLMVMTWLLITLRQVQQLRTASSLTLVEEAQAT